jgi:AcrR family transcriptional regulator
MSEAAVLPRGNAVAQSTDARGEAQTGQVQKPQTTPTPSAQSPSDGRNRRAAETRRKIIAAAKAMISETSTAPTVVAVAKRADVSVRSVFQHFHDVESLFVTVVDSISNDLEVPQAAPASQPLSQRIDSVVENLAQMFDKIVPLRVAAGQFANHPGLIERGQALKSELRRVTFEVFSPEFAALSEAARDELADAIGAALSLDAWIVLRRQDGLSFERATAVWRRTLTALLTHGAQASAAETQVSAAE